MAEVELFTQIWHYAVSVFFCADFRHKKYPAELPVDSAVFCGILLWKSVLFNDGSCLLTVSVFGVSHIGDDGTASGAFFNEGNTCFDLRKHGACCKLILINVFAGICNRNSVQISFFVSIFIQADFLNAGEDQKRICI